MLVLLVRIGTIYGIIVGQCHFSAGRIQTNDYHFGSQKLVFFCLRVDLLPIGAVVKRVGSYNIDESSFPRSGRTFLLFCLLLQKPRYRRLSRLKINISGHFPIGADLLHTFLISAGYNRILSSIGSFIRNGCRCATRRRLSYHTYNLTAQGSPSHVTFPLSPPDTLRVSNLAIH